MRYRPVGMNVFHRCLIGVDGHAKMAGTTEDDAALVTVFSGAPEVATWITGLWNFLIDDAIKVLLAVEMVVTVKENVDVVLHQQLVNRQRPARTFLFENVFPIQILAAPLEERRDFHAAPALSVATADEMMDEDEFEFRLTGFECLL